jgi:hypothetical protein
MNINALSPRMGKAREFAGHQAKQEAPLAATTNPSMDLHTLLFQTCITICICSNITLKVFASNDFAQRLFCGDWAAAATPAHIRQTLAPQLHR